MALREQLRSGDKALIGNKGYRRYLSGSDSPHFRIDEAKIVEDARYDGKWVLRTNTDLDSAEVALQYKQLWMVEHLFRPCKSLLQTRPIFHRCDETTRVMSSARSWRWSCVRDSSPGWRSGATSRSGPM